MPRPRPIRPQNRRALAEGVFRFRRKAAVAHNKTTFCRMSPKAVRPKLRGTNNDSDTCTHTNAHTMAIHVRACWSGDFPTPQFYVCPNRSMSYGSNRETEKKSRFIRQTGQTKTAAQSGRRRDRSCIRGWARFGRYLVRASRRPLPPQPDACTVRAPGVPGEWRVERRGAAVLAE